MEVVVAAASWVLSSACRQWPTTRSWLGELCPDRIPSRDLDALRARLSEHAQVHLPRTDDFAAASARWSALGAPTVDIVVVPATEQDVAETASLHHAFHSDGELTVNTGRVRQRP